MSYPKIVIGFCILFAAWCGYVNKRHELRQQATKHVTLWKANEQPGFIDHAMQIAESNRTKADKIICLWGTPEEVAQCK